MIGEDAVQTAPNPSDNSIGARRGLSDFSTRVDIAKTSVNGTSGSMSASARCTAAVVESMSSRVRMAKPNPRLGDCAYGM
jgi:hypothetical protein